MRSKRLSQALFEFEVAALAFANLAGSQESSTSHELYLRAGNLYFKKLHKLKEAEECYQKILHLDKEDRDALSALDAIYKETEDFSNRLGILLTRAQIESEPAKRGAFFVEGAAIAEENLRDKKRAKEIWQSFLETEEEDMRALGALVRLSEGSGRVARC